MSNKTSLVILAAGMGSRYGGIKQIDQFGPSGETILDYSIYDAINAGFEKIVLIIRESFRTEISQLFSAKVGDRAELHFVNQEMTDLPQGFSLPPNREKPWGTSHAVWAARHVVNEPFAVINADDYYGIGAFEIVREFLISPSNNAKDYAIIAYQLDKTMSEHGTVNRGVCQARGSFLKSIHERLKLGYTEDGRIAYPSEDGKLNYLSRETPVSMNFWGFHPDYFDYCTESFIRFLSDSRNLEKAEFFIPILIEELVKSRTKRVKMLTCDAEWFGVTYKEDKPHVQQRIQKLVDSGVYSANLWG